MELSVGVFVLVGILALGYLSIQLGGMDVFGTDSYDIRAKFSSVTGLRPGASVEMAGVQIGKVENIALVDNEAMVTLRIDKNVKLAIDTIASIRTKGILGEKYVSLSQGGSPRMIAAGGRIRETEPPIDIEKLIGQYIFGKVK